MHASSPFLKLPIRIAAATALFTVPALLHFAPAAIAAGSPTSSRR